MSNIAIRVQNLSKRYRIGQREPYYTFRDLLARGLNVSLRRLGASFRSHASFGQNTLDPESKHIWALKDVSFEIEKGEVVGIIGRNGAGKSTLLKILSRITSPTEGQAEIYGRVGSLLEVGTGFHPELTGRENVYLNGAILGMRKTEIDRKFDEIVAFAEVEKFIDTPVKHFSTGMYLRLAFAVAAHLQPEILLVDEVLAVGDVTFQKKCLGKIEDIAKGGRTVFFVSHQLNSIRKLCERCIWLDAGRIRMIGPTVKVLTSYEMALTAMPLDDRRKTDHENVGARFLRWEILEPRSEQHNLLNTLGPITFKFVVQVNTPILNGVHGIALWNSNSELMWAWATYNLDVKPGTHEFEYALQGLPLRPGVYSWHVTLYNDGHLMDEWHCVPELVIATEPLTHPHDEWSGVLNIPCVFQAHRMNDSHEKDLGL